MTNAWSIWCGSQSQGAKMETMPGSAGSAPDTCSSRSGGTNPALAEIHESVLRLCLWLEANDYSGYDPFDGLNARLMRPLTLENPLLRTVLQQGVRRFPLNLRPVLGVSKSRSTKGMGFVARGYIRLLQATGEPTWANKAEAILEWLIRHQTPGYSGTCWGNHFDYQSRTFYLPKGMPTV